VNRQYNEYLRVLIGAAAEEAVWLIVENQQDAQTAVVTAAKNSVTAMAAYQVLAKGNEELRNAVGPALVRNMDNYWGGVVARLEAIEASKRRRSGHVGVGGGVVQTNHPTHHNNQIVQVATNTGTNSNQTDEYGNRLYFQNGSMVRGSNGRYLVYAPDGGICCTDSAGNLCGIDNNGRIIGPYVSTRNQPTSTVGSS